MIISLILPSYRHSYSALARMMEWSSLDPTKFELVVRDNSGNKEKRDFLGRLISPTLKIHSVDPCDAFENALSALRLATGDFVFFVADDDWLSIRGLEQLHTFIENNCSDASIGCFTGDYLVEATEYSYMFRYGAIDANDTHQRISSYLNSNASNFLYYSIVRRSLVETCFQFMDDLPYKFSYHDQVISLIYLTLGRVLKIERVVYGYDLGEWETAEKSLAKDRSIYVAAGLPIEYDRLHHLFCALEGALLLNSNLILDKVGENTAASADLWFQTMFSKFIHHRRELPASNSDADLAIMKFQGKLLAQNSWNYQELLLDFSEILEVADPAGAQRYFKFWSTL
jgi:hypothetical protein